ncbi:hypothetical protein KCU89_g2115, partial [Aureobasidium melanogenum]
MRPPLLPTGSTHQVGVDGELRFFTPVSAYIPEAGFLWTDERIWSEQYGSFVASQQESGQNRVILNDKINRMCPWSFEPVNGNTGSTILPGQQVYLRSVETGHYVTALREEPATTDLYLNVDYPNNEPRRTKIL